MFIFLLPFIPVSLATCSYGRFDFVRRLLIIHAYFYWGSTNRHEAAYRLAGNAEAVTRFACRGAGRGSGWSLLPGRAPLSDPNAVPNLDIMPDVDYCLRIVSRTVCTHYLTIKTAPRLDVVRDFHL